MSIVVPLLLSAIVTSPLSDLKDSDTVVTYASVIPGSATVDTNSTVPLVAYGDNHRLSASMNRSGSQTYMFPTNTAFVWIPEDADLRFGGRRESDGTVVGTRSFGSRISVAVDNATNGLVSLASPEWTAITNTVANFAMSEINMAAKNGDYLYGYATRADGRVTKNVYRIHEVTRTATTQGVISVEYPMYMFRRGQADGTSYTIAGTWKGPYYKKVSGELKWEYDSAKTSSDLVGYTSDGAVSSSVRNYYFTGGYASNASRYSFAYNGTASTSLCAIVPYATWWITKNYAKNAYAPLGGSVLFDNALKGTNTEEYVGYGDLYRPNVQAKYEGSRWYLDRSVGSGEYYTYVGPIPYSWTEVVTNLVESYTLHTTTSEGEMMFIPSTNGLTYAVKELSNLTSPWHIALNYIGRVANADLPYRGRNSDGDYIWSCHGNSSMWTGNPTSEWGTVIWRTKEERWVFTGGLTQWYVPSSGDTNSIYYMDFADSVPYPPGFVNYPCNELSTTGAVVTAARFTDSYGSAWPEFSGTYTRSLPIESRWVTNSISGSVDIETLKHTFVQRSVTTNGFTYAARPRRLNGNIIMVYEKESGEP